MNWGKYTNFQNLNNLEMKFKHLSHKTIANAKNSKIINKVKINQNYYSNGVNKLPNLNFLKDGLNNASQMTTQKNLEEVQMFLRGCASVNKHVNRQLSNLIKQVDANLIPVFKDERFQYVLRKKFNISSADLYKLKRLLNKFNSKNSSIVLITILFLIFGSSLTATINILRSKNIFIIIVTILDYVTEAVQLAWIFKRDKRNRQLE
ncbi:hypothetical protein GYW21_05355 [Lactobacillus mellis]|nr:hypothetical protein [Bombilactobacillus mellis]